MKLIIRCCICCFAGLLVLLNTTGLYAHDPVFGLGPHTLFKGGIEIASEFHSEKKADEKEYELGLELVYGITGDWSAGMEFPYLWQDVESTKSSGLGDIQLFTKYRFWRHDTLGAQESAAVLLKVVTETGDEDEPPGLETGSTDGILGLTYGYEGRKWYRWASLRYRRNGRYEAQLRRGDKILVDLVGGIRPKPSGYREPDTVWLLELNGEYGKQTKLNQMTLDNTGGMEWFISPGIFWTLRNFAVKAGVKIPVISNLNGDQDKTDYQATLVLEWHL